MRLHSESGFLAERQGRRVLWVNDTGPRLKEHIGKTPERPCTATQKNVDGHRRSVTN